ncbi:hypothetical protein BLNAU_3950 [Blattamonas nauphoetae]|uniref:Uncharacterized protein n=1 Tax=Blattamonas nauphoetae TaxID=2049346 RepID=A0ABQ9YBN8_9EUKA|nr:hypothetical protein BLNAU_3950 [Blattamonas nauphoetae]
MHTWGIIVEVTSKSAGSHQKNFRRIIISLTSFPDLILNSLKLTHQGIRENTLDAITNIVNRYGKMRQQFISADLVSQMFKAVDFISFPLSESKTLFHLTKFISTMLDPMRDDEEEQFEQYPLIRVSVFQPVQQFIKLIFHNSDKLVLEEEDNFHFENHLRWIHIHITNMELRSDELDTDIVSELVKWEVRTMVKMENESQFKFVFQSMLSRTWEWNQDKRERQKRREVVLREEGWDDVFELRVVGIEVGTNQKLLSFASRFRVKFAFNLDEL